MTECLIRKYYLERHYSCASVILHTCKELWQLELSDDTARHIDNISTWYRKEDICCAYSACINLIPLLVNGTEDGKHSGLDTDVVGTLFDLFNRRFGGRQCSKIKQQCFQNDTGCLQVLLQIAETMEELLCHLDCDFTNLTL